MTKIIVSIMALLVGGLVVWGIRNAGQENLGRGLDSRFNSVGSLTSFSTTTGSFCAACPVQVLAYDTDRRYALFQNNSDTDIWLFATTTELSLTGTGAARYATGAITFLSEGILLEAKKAGAPVATWVLTPENMVYGHIYATSTAVSKRINVNYSQ